MWGANHISGSRLFSEWKERGRGMSALELAGREVHARALLYSVVLGLDRSQSLPWASQGSVESQGSGN